MKQSDIVTIAVVGILGFIVSYFLLNAILTDPDEASVTFTTIAEVDNNLAEPSPNIFNSQAINPTIEVFVGGCVDINQDGSLDEAESALCGKNTIEVENGTEENANNSDAEKTEDSSTESSSDAEDDLTTITETEDEIIEVE